LLKSGREERGGRGETGIGIHRLLMASSRERACRLVLRRMTASRARLGEEFGCDESVKGVIGGLGDRVLKAAAAGETGRRWSEEGLPRRRKKAARRDVVPVEPVESAVDGRGGMTNAAWGARRGMKNEHSERKRARGSLSP
jgi:hypothetical protein